MKYILTAILLFNVAFGQSLFGVVAGDGFDIDARRYLDSAGVTNQTHRNALNTFVKGMKSTGLWSKFLAIYPMMGSTSNSMRWNLKDPRNLDAAYRLSFVGSDWSFDATLGAVPNKSTGGSYANTFIPSNVYGDITSMHLSYASSENLNNLTNYVFEVGARPNFSDNINELSLVVKLPNVAAVSPNQNLSVGGIGGGVFALSTWNAVSDTRGLFVTTRTSTTSLKFFQNANLISSNTGTETNTTGSTRTIYLAALNAGGTTLHTSNRACIFASVGLGLSDSEVSTYNTLFQAFKTAIGR